MVWQSCCLVVQLCPQVCHADPPPLIVLPPRPSASDEHKFKDSSSLYYCFTADDSLDETSGKKSLQAQKQDIIRRLREVAVRRVDVSMWVLRE